LPHPLATELSVFFGSLLVGYLLPDSLCFEFATDLVAEIL
jgi:hypothetical protein